MIEVLVRNISDEATPDLLQNFLSTLIDCKLTKYVSEPKTSYAVIKIKDWKTYRNIKKLTRKQKKFFERGLLFDPIGEQNNRDIFFKRKRRQGHYNI